ADLDPGDHGAELHQPLDAAGLARERLARKTFDEMVHAAGGLEQRGLPGIVAIAKDPVVPHVRAENLLERERAQRLAWLGGRPRRNLVSGPARLVAVGIGRVLARRLD